MFRLALLFFAALFLIDAGILGNIGAILGSIIDPANMVESNTNNSSSTGNTPTTPKGASGGF